MTAAPKLNVETFEGRRRPPKPLRLSAEHVADLRAAFFDAESDAGMRSRFWVDVERRAGTLPKDFDTHLFDVETWCDKRRVWVRAGEHMRLWRCIDALHRMAETAEGRTHTVVLYRVYGPIPPNARYDLFERDNRELAPLLVYTPTVRALHGEATTALVARRLAAAESALADPFRREASERAIRRGVELELRPATVLRDALTVRVDPKPKEPKAALRARREVAMQARKELVATLAREAERLLVAASAAYKTARGVQ